MTLPTLEEWRALTRRDREAVWQHLTRAERLDMYGQLAATTPGWELPYPVDYNDPADSPTSFRALAEAVDASLTTIDVGHMPNTLTDYAIPRTSGWAYSPPPEASKTGKLVVLTGVFSRDATLDADAQTAYRLGTMSSTGHQPSANLRCAVPWSAGGVRRVGQAWIYADGVIEWVPTVSASLGEGDWVSISGITYVAS